MTLRVKASVLLCLIITIALSTSGYYYINFFESSLRDSILKSLTSVSYSLSQEISHFLSDRQREAQAIAQAIPKAAIDKKDVQKVDAILRFYSTVFNKFENGMFILDEHGKLWADYPKHPEVRGKSFAFRQYFQKTMQARKGIVGEPYRSARTGEPVLTFTAPLKDSAGRIAGMLGCSVQLTSPRALEGIRMAKIGHSGYIYVYNKDRLMILHPQKNRILKKDVPVGANKLFDAAIKGFEGTGETVNSRGIPMLISMKQIPGSDWILGVQQPKHEAFAPIKSAKTKIIWGIFLVTAISVIIGYYFMKGITRPLNKLQDAVRMLGKIGERDNDALLDAFKNEIDTVKTTGEIGNLKIAFRTMSEKLYLTLQSLHKLAADWENTFDSVLDVIFLLDDRNRIVRVNRAAIALLETSYDEPIGQSIFNVLDIEPHKIALNAEPSAEQAISFNIKVKGNQVYEIYCNALVDENKQSIGKVLVGRDITFRLEATRETLRLKDKLQKAQKMEAIGTLAGGVAHDLNNILSGIVSYPELLLLQEPPDSPLVKPLETILQSGKKATAIVQDLLTLARRGTETIEVINLNVIIKEYLASPEHNKIKSYHPHVGESVILADDLLNMEGSPVHLSKVIMNLISNAAEAMPDGGHIRISTENRYVDTQIKGSEDIHEGDYVVLTISDEGQGIAPDDLDRIYEPFYTKKKMGNSGTGLGMSVVWGTVKDHKGFIDIESVVASGSTFKLYFPATRKSMESQKEAIDMDRLRGNNETILVVDDVENQRIIASSILTQLGYSVSSVSSGEKALEYMKNRPVDLLVLDMIMKPGINGLETYRRALRIRPDQKTIITSGYSETELVRQAQAMGAGSYVKKPYAIEKIGIAVKKELSGGIHSRPIDTAIAHAV